MKNVIIALVVAVFGATGGASGVHEHSALFLNGRLYLAVANSVEIGRAHV